MKQKRKRVAVTGASGFVGSHLCEELSKRGYDVAGLDVTNCDVTSYGKVFQVLKERKPEAVFHTAAFIPEKEEDMSLLFKVNVLGTINLLEACRALRIRNFIYSSSMSIYGAGQKMPAKESFVPLPSSFYGLSKWMGEECAKLYAKKYGISAVALRYTGVYGFGKDKGAVYSFFKNAASNRPLEIMADDDWDIVFVKDVVRANMAALEKINKVVGSSGGFVVINIGSGRKIGIKELAERIIKISRSKSEIKTNKSSPGVCFCADISRAKEMLGFKPTSIDAGLRQYFKEIKKRQ